MSEHMSDRMSLGGDHSEKVIFYGRSMFGTFASSYFSLFRHVSIDRHTFFDPYWLLILFSSYIWFLYMTNFATAALTFLSF